MTKTAKPLSAEFLYPEIELLSEQTYDAPIRATEYAEKVVNNWLQTVHESDYDRDMARRSAVAVLSGALDGCPYQNFDRIWSSLETQDEAEADCEVADVVSIGAVAVSSAVRPRMLPAAAVI